MDITLLKELSGRKRFKMSEYVKVMNEIRHLSETAQALTHMFYLIYSIVESVHNFISI